MDFVSGFKRHMVKPESKIQNLKWLIEKLRYERDRRLHSIEVANEKGEETDRDVQRWVALAEAKIKEEEETVKKLEAQAKKRCFVGLCPNLKALDLINKKAEKDAQAVMELIEQAESHKFNSQRKVQILESQPEAEKRNRLMDVVLGKKIANEAEKVNKVEEKVCDLAKDEIKAISKPVVEQCRLGLDGGLYLGDTQVIESKPIQGFEAFGSRKATLEDILKALKDSDLKIIGVHGMISVGKTMLVKEVARRAKEESLFDEIAMATVSRNPNVKEIQGKIVDVLGHKLDEESVFARATRLQQWLKKEDKRVLLILDDIWHGQRLELEEIGISFEGYKNNASEEDPGPFM